jgi:hypothetical protein
MGTMAVLVVAINPPLNSQPRSKNAMAVFGTTRPGQEQRYKVAIGEKGFLASVELIRRTSHK